MKELFICISCNPLVTIIHRNELRVSNKMEDNMFGCDVDKIPSQEIL